ncbi:PQQ-binding-like beta-propeller repeat protein [Paractinoplanes globisporus]|uniref:PQQ-binding-like beta-propeller repeat protein n=1 Tax=Paractinoplanes globisporus TaxID=113565 RepID=A0ABW6WKM1_9ACTN|nr:PQQ-binding-like beta-propeller repeat protein [Actinoplanes globisporus]
MSNAVIDLGEVPDRRATPAEMPMRRPPVPYRALLAALSVVLLVLLGGATYQHPPPAPTVIPAKLGDTFTLDGDRMYVIAAGGVDSFDAVRDRVVTTYRLPSMRLLSRTTVSVAGTVVGVQQAGDTVIVGYQLDASGNQETVAYPVGGGTVLWRRPDRFVAASVADGTALLSTADGDVAVDLATGQERWRVPRPTDGFVAESGVGNGFPDWVVVLSDSGRLETWDAHTGQRRATASVPGAADRITGMIWPVSQYLLIAEDGGYDGYRLPGLQRLWHTTVDLRQSWMQSDCGSVICTFRQQQGMTVLDPADGHALWDSDRWVYAEPLGPYLLATASTVESDVPELWVLDPRTGRALGNFGAWQGLAPAGNGLIYGKRDVRGSYQVFYGLLDPADRSVDVLGLADRVSGGCETSAGVLVCRLIDASVAVWRLR